MFPVHFASLEQFLNGGLVITLVFFFAFLLCSSSCFLAFNSRTWPTTTGHIVESTVRRSESHTSGDSRPTVSYEPLIRYTYQVDGQQLESKQIAVGRWTGSETYVKSIIRKYPERADVTVYHHPRRHQLAVLEPGKYIMLLFLTLLFGVVFCVVAVTWVRLSLNPELNPWAEFRQLFSREK